jgi:SNARE protein
MSNEIDTLKMELANAKRENDEDKVKDLKIKIREMRQNLKIEKIKNSQNYPLETENDLINHGRNIQDESLESVKRIAVIVNETKEIAGTTANTIHINTEQLSHVKDNIYEIDNMLSRSVLIIKKMSRKIASNRLLWIMIFLIVVGIILIIITKVN